MDNMSFEVSEGEVFGLLFTCGVLLTIGICTFLIGYAKASPSYNEVTLPLDLNCENSPEFTALSKLRYEDWCCC